MPVTNRRRVFVSYSHKDKMWLDRLREILAPDIRNDRVDYWDDRELQPGDPWYDRILDGINMARVAVLLVSPNFLASPFIVNEELPRILAAQDDGLTVVWIPIFGTFHGPDAPRQFEAICNLQAAFDAATPLADQDPAIQTTLLLDICHHIQRLLNPSRIPCNLPFGSLAAAFKGRDRVLTDLDCRIRREGSAAVFQPHAIQGLGGIGKTRLAIEYAWRHQNDFTAFLFVSANTPHDLDRNLASLCRPDCLDLREHQSPKQDEQRDAAIRWLQENKGWLLILDNVDTDEGVRAAKTLVGKLLGGHVLITSRITEWGRGVHSLPLDVLSIDDAVAFLLESAHTWRAKQAQDAAQARGLAERLGCLPLALAHATAYMQHHYQGFSDYLVDFDHHFERLLEYFDHLAIEYETEFPEDNGEPPDPTSRTTQQAMVKTVATTFFLSFDRMTTEAKTILQATAFLAPAPVPLAIFDESTDRIAAISNLWCVGSGDAKTGQRTSDAVATLARYSLITRSEGQFSVHRMLQEKILPRRLSREQRGIWALEVAGLVAQSAPPVNPHEPATWEGWDALLPHAEHVLQTLDNSPKSWALASLPLELSLLCYGKGLYDRGIPYARQGLSLHEASLGPKATETLRSLSSLADLLYKRWDLVSAQPLFNRLVDASVQVLGPQNPDTLMRRNAQALCTEMKDGFAAAEPLYRAALADATSALGEVHPVTLDTADNFAGALLAQGKHVEAEQMFRRVLADRTQVLGKDHRHTCVTMNNLAVVLTALDKKVEAGQLYRSALECLQRTLGPEHPDYLLILENYGAHLCNEGEIACAVSLFRRLLDTREKTLGVEHPSTLQTLKQVETLLYKLGDKVALRELYQHAMKVRETEL